MGSLGTEESTGKHLVSLILKGLEELKVPFMGCRGQSYDNGASMRRKKNGVQSRLLEINPRALFVPCGAHSLNLLVADAAKESIDATSYFGILQMLHNLFSASAQSWAILKKNM